MVETAIKTAITDRVNPILAEHFGEAELSSYEDGVVYVRLAGACGSCPSAKYTVEDVIKAEIMDAVSEVKDVKLDDSLSEDILDMARNILNHKV
jgi:Fe-S cluster biogenesis protein NfuA